MFALCILNTAQAQKEGTVWHFGQGAALDFNSGTAVITTPSAMRTFEGSASIADANGNLLFYTNGGGRDPILSGQSSGKIWNRNHQVMYDMGNTEGGGFSAAQSSVIVPKPGASGKYFLFTMEELEFDVGGSVPGQPQGRGLSYFEIDMALNGGLGGVSAYSGMVYTQTYEGLCTVRHANGSDCWILVHQSNGTGLAVFPVTAAGLGIPAFYATGGGSSADIKASPDGQWVSSGSIGGQNLLRFDPATGILSSPLVLGNQANRSAEFSPNSKRLFILNSTNQVQYYDLTSPNINASLTTVATVPSDGIINGQMQLAPDGEIYFTQTAFFTQSVLLSTIVCPNTAPFLNLKKFSFPFGADGFFFGLPNFDNALFKKDQDPPLPLNLIKDQNLCGMDTLLLDPGIANAIYQWSTGAQTQTLSVTNPGTFIVTVTAAGCGVAIDTIEVQQVGTLTVNAGPDQIICASNLIPLNGSGNGAFSWSPDTLVSNPAIANPIFTGDSDAQLVLTVSQGNCMVQDTLNLTVLESPVASAQPTDSTLLSGESVQLSGTGIGTIAWSPADDLSCVNCLNPIATPDSTTTYILSITNNQGCTDTAQVLLRVTPPDCEPDIPNAFTPNGDGANDRFQPIGKSIESYDLTIYTRWGQKIYQENTPWDGRGYGIDRCNQRCLHLPDKY